MFFDSDQLDSQLLEVLETLKEQLFGPAKDRDITRPGSAPIEQRDDGTPIKPVEENFRCYPLGVTYEVQTMIGAPNANCKVTIEEDAHNKLRSELLKVNFLLLIHSSLLLTQSYTGIHQHCMRWSQRPSQRNVWSSEEAAWCSQSPKDWIIWKYILALHSVKSCHGHASRKWYVFWFKP